MPTDETARIESQQDVSTQLQAQCLRAAADCGAVAARMQHHEELASRLQEQCQRAAAQCDAVATRAAASWEELHQGLADVSVRQAAAMQLLQAHAQQQQRDREMQAAGLQAAAQQQQQAQTAQAAAVQFAMTEFAKRMDTLELLNERLAKHVLLAGRAAKAVR